MEPDCDRLYGFGADEKSINFAINWTYPKHDFQTEINESCQQFLKKSRYILTTNDDEERKFGIAFTIVTYKNAVQVERLLRTIYRPWNSYCIHVDLKADKKIFIALDSLTNCLNSKYGNIVNTKNRVSVIWGHMTALIADLNCMKELYERYKTWKYLINLTGQEFPLKTNRELVQIFKAFNGANCVEGHFIKHTNLPLAFQLNWYRGSTHISVSRDFISYIFESPKAKTILETVEYLPTPDEHYFNTLNFNPQLKIPGSFVGDIEENSQIDNQKHYYFARYKSNLGYRCRSEIYLRHLCIWGIRDLPNLVSAKHFVANKFVEESQPAVLRCLERWYYKKVNTETETGKTDIDIEFYKSLIIVRDQYQPPK